MVLIICYDSRLTVPLIVWQCLHNNSNYSSAIIKLFVINYLKFVKMKLFLLLLLLIGICNCIITNSKSNVRFVNPTIGTLTLESSNYGGMIPTTGTPFAMTRWTPYTQENIVSSCPYEYEHNLFHGFLGTHQPAVW